MKDINYKIKVSCDRERFNKKGTVLDGVNIDFEMINGFMIVKVGLVNVHDIVFLDVIGHSTCFETNKSFAEDTEKIEFPVLTIKDLDTIVHHDTQMEIGAELHLPEKFDKYKVSEVIMNRITLIVSNINKFKSGMYSTKKYSFLLE